MPEDIDFSNATVDTSHSMNQPGAASLLDAFKTGVGHAVAKAGSTLNPLNIPEAVYETGKNVYNAASSGDYAGAVGAAALNPPAAQDLANQRASDAYAKGNHAEGALHQLFSVLPLVGPTGEEAYNNMLEGVRSGDPGKIGDAIGGIGAMLTPEALRLSKHLPSSVSETAMRSAGDSYYKTITPIDVSNKVPAAQRAALDLAKGPAPVAMTRQGFIDKLAAGAKVSGENSEDAINFDKTGRTGPVRPLLDALDAYSRDNYTSPHVNGGRVPIHMSGIQAIQDLKDEVVKASGGNKPAPGLLAPGQQPPPNIPVTDVALEHTEKLRQGLEKGTLNNKGDWRTDINPESVQAMDRAHARIIRRWQDDHAPDIQEGRDPSRMFNQMLDRSQEVKNRLDAGGPKKIPLVGALKAGEVPQAIQNSAANIPWNTWSGNRKAALSKAIKSGDWGSVQNMLRAAKLGIGADDAN